MSESDLTLESQCPKCFYPPVVRTDRCGRDSQREPTAIAPETALFLFQAGTIALRSATIALETALFRFKVGMMPFEIRTIALQPATIALETALFRFQIGMMSLETGTIVP